MADWQLPTGIDLPRSETPHVDVEDLSSTLLRTLCDLGAPAQIHRVLVGPSTISYELIPDAKTRMRDFSRLGRKADLAYALSSETVRLNAPIPGKSLVGVEIPNPSRRSVGLREVIPYVQAPLRAGLGIETSGRALTLDLGGLPHLAVAGASGSGKSSLLHSMICSLLMRATPDQLALLLIDVKMVEFGTRYRDLPHLYSQPITNVDDSIEALWWLVGEVEARFKLLDRYGCQNLEEYNRKAPEGRVPSVLCVCDELGDLMLRSRDRVESAVVRLGQLGRACGVHLVLATQSPHSTVFSGLIKANMTGRIAMKVVSGVHSRVAIDQSGAEQLLGRGDGLLQDGRSVNLKRFQGCYTKPETIDQIISWWSSQVPAQAAA